jgi:hypothetical protein
MATAQAEPIVNPLEQRLFNRQLLALDLVDVLEPGDNHPD